MAADVGGLIGDIGLNVAGLRQDIKQSNSELRRGTNRMNRHLGSMRRKVNSVTQGFKGMVAAISFGLAVREIRNAVSAVSELGKAAKTAGVEVETLQELQFAFGQLAGTTDKEVGESIRRFNRRLGLAIQGTGEAKATFKQLGIEFLNTAGKIRTTDDILEEALLKLSGIENDSIRAARASQVFGEDAGPRLAAALADGIKALETQRDRARELGLVLSNETVAGAEEAEDRITELSKSLGVKFQDTVLNNVDGIIALANAMSTAADKTFGFIEAVGKLGEIAAGATGFGAQSDVIERQIEALQRERALLQSPFGGIQQPGSEQRIAEINEQIRALKSAQLEVLTRPGDEETAGASGRSLGEAFTEGFQSEIKLDIGGPLSADRLTPELSADQVFPLRDIVESAFADAEDVADDSAEKMENRFTGLAESIGFSLQRSLSDAFLGAESSFGDMLRRMAADFLSSGLLKVLGSLIPGPFGQAFTQSLHGFASGGSFQVGGSGGTDSQLVAFRASPNETVTVTRPDQRMGSSPTTIVQNYNFPLAATPQFEAMVRNSAGAAGRDAALGVIRARQGRF